MDPQGDAVEEAAGISCGKGNEVPSAPVLHKGWRGICPWRGETLPTGVRSPFQRGVPRVPAGGAGSWAGGAVGDGEKGAAEHGQGGVPVPGPVLADLVVAQPGLAFRLGEAVLDSLSGARDRGDLGKRDVTGRPAAEEEKALARTTPPDARPGRYKPPDQLLAFLESL
jgi:hypothetical protein